MGDELAVSGQLPLATYGQIPLAANSLQGFASSRRGCEAGIHLGKISTTTDRER